ncbi:TetR/AcrR family transcriptional regulator [Xylocopilactobacillus apicola]|uniref:TetR family transcriptional regulator n=1 Tax=Xylocopilactobacillus apicola TaxID=2932184 RepID=A0AAU9DDI1_9LACO|nr:TetR/AcrR family transcriptional regulator [Xylocopilactobacillus apicola]BDR57870.1 TetR family transcriptional regulator [Xylocopilactobacillus apicola]
MNKELPAIYCKTKELENLSEKQRLIFKAALHLFAQNGFATTSTQEIATVAKVSEGTLFKKFGNKKELLIMIIKPLAEELLPTHPLNFFNDDQIKLNDFVFTFFTNQIRFIKQNILPVQVLVKEVTYNRKMADTFISWIPTVRIEELNQILDLLKAQGQLVNWPDSEIIRFLLAELMGYVLQHYFLFLETDWDDFSEITRIINFTIKGLTPE